MTEESKDNQDDLKVDEPVTEISAENVPSTSAEVENLRQALAAKELEAKTNYDRFLRQVADLEKEIARVEREIADLELYFQNPATGTDWETTHRRYAELKDRLDSLYSEIATRWELMG